MRPPPDAAEAPAAPAIIFVNGKKHLLPPGRGDATLLQYLRDDLRLTGTKLVCGEGGCGACTVTLVDRNNNGRIRARPVNACLFPLYAAEGAAVVTVEGLESENDGKGGRRREKGGLHPLSAALAGAHGSQCGFCSPGFVMAAHSCLAAHAVRRKQQQHEDGGGGSGGGTRLCPASSSPSPSSLSSSFQKKPAEDIEEVFSGNLCRCTGYRPIIDAFRPFFDEGGEAREAEEGRRGGEERKTRFAPPARPNGEEGGGEQAPSASSPSSSPLIDASALLPRELLTRPKPELRLLPASGENGVEWHRPTSLRSLLRLRASSHLLRGGSPCTFIGGNTEVGIECAQKGMRHAVRVDVGSVPELAVLDFGRGGGGGREGKEESENGADEPGESGSRITIGAGATLEDLFEAAKASSSSSSGAASAIASQLRRFAGRAVRGAAVVGGNVATASPASDLNPVFVACGALFDVARLEKPEKRHCDGDGDCREGSSPPASPVFATRSVPAAEFFRGYRKVDLGPDEVLVRVRLPRWGGDGGVVDVAASSSGGGHKTNTSPPPPLRRCCRRRPLDFVQAFKQARRRDDDISIVTACFAVRFEAQEIGEKEGEGKGEKGDEAFVVSEASFCFGGVAATPLSCPRAAAALLGTRWSFNDYERALRALAKEDVVIPDDAPGGAVPFRRALVASAFARFFAAAHRRLKEVVASSSSSSSSSSRSTLSPPPVLPSWLSSASDGLPPRPPPRSLQYWEVTENSKVIGVPLRHLSADLQAAGRARYVADEPLLPGTLHGALVLSTRAAARVASIDASKVAAAASGSSTAESSIPFFFFGAADVPGTNRWGPLLGDPLFVGVGERCEAVGLPLGIVVAESEGAARRAALQVEVEYFDDDGADECGSEKNSSRPSSSPSSPTPILTIEDAIAANSFFEAMDREMDHGEGGIDELLAGYEREAAGSARSGGAAAAAAGGEGSGGGSGGGGGRKVAVVEGAIRIGGQEHFYLEPHSALAVPGERGTSTELDVLSSTQAPSGTQLDVARAVGLPLHSVVCRATRLGGGFGGKETRAGGVAAAAGVAAFLTKRPVRLVLERHVDAAISGGRHPFYVQWKVAAEVVSSRQEGEGNGAAEATEAKTFSASEEGNSTSSTATTATTARILAADLRLFSNAGCSPDLSGPVMERALMHCANAYSVPRLRAKGRVARTNATSNTAFRGFGAPQGMLAFEAAAEQAAAALGVAPEVLREGSLIQDGDTTPYGTLVRDCQARACWDECLRGSDFAARRAEIERFNASSRWVKRGIAVVPTMFGVSFTHKTYNQAGAQVSVFAADGSVLVSHGGVEMGQGLHTKVAAVAAAALGVLREGGGEKEEEAGKINPLPLSAVRVASATRTDLVPNSSPTAASASSDLYGGAVADACRQLMGRLRPYLLKAAAKAAASPSSAEGKQGEGSSSSSPTFSVWKSAVAAAYADRIDLCAHGFYTTPGLGGWGSGSPFAYCSFGAAAVEAQVDCLTGDSCVRRADVFMDVGRSLNPAIDVGQVEGAFAQGLGWATMEEVVKCDASHAWVGRGNGRGRGKSFCAAAAASGAGAAARAAQTSLSPPPPPLSSPLDGSTHTRGPGTYKIPSADDTPSDFRVSLLRGSRNAVTAKTVHSSKAVGEPPFFLGAATFFALKRAVGAAREDAFAEGRGAERGGGEGGRKAALPLYFRLDLPATSEALRLSAAGLDDDDAEDEGEESNKALDAVARAAGVKGRRSRVSC